MDHHASDVTGYVHVSQMGAGFQSAPLEQGHAIHYDVGSQRPAVDTLRPIIEPEGSSNSRVRYYVWYYDIDLAEGNRCLDITLRHGCPWELLLGRRLDIIHSMPFSPTLKTRPEIKLPRCKTVGLSVFIPIPLNS